MRRQRIIVAVFVLVVAGCNKKPPVDKVTYVADDDPQMNAAMEKARSSVNKFVAALRSPKPGQSGFAVKMAFTDSNGTKHMWLSPVSYDGKSFHGTVNNEPEKVKSVKIGQKVSVEPSKISATAAGKGEVRRRRHSEPRTKRNGVSGQTCRQGGPFTPLRFAPDSDST